jgi:hypothetical protein
MSGVNFKEVVLIASDAVSYGVNWTPFNLLLLAGSFTHMVIIALNDCHSDKGETSFFCGKAWINCKIAQNMTYVSIGNSSTLCPIRTCFEPNCVPQMINFDDRPAFADVLQMANFVMRWVSFNPLNVHAKITPKRLELTMLRQDAVDSGEGEEM